MSGYELTRQWFDFVFENPDKSSTAQAALYMWLIESNNRCGFSEKFIFNTSDACRYTGIKNRKTIWIALNSLVENGFVTMVTKAKNQEEVTVLSIIKNKVKSNGCLDKSILNEKRLSEIRTDVETATTLADGLADGLADTLAAGHSNKQQTTKNKPQTVRAEIVFPFEDARFVEYWDRWKAYKKVQHKFTYKSIDSESQALQALHTDSGQNLEHAIEIINYSMAQGYKGLYAPKTFKTGNTIPLYPNGYRNDSDLPPGAITSGPLRGMVM